MSIFFGKSEGEDPVALGNTAVLEWMAIDYPG
jgi:hypothetical protein